MAHSVGAATSLRTTAEGVNRRLYGAFVPGTSGLPPARPPRQSTAGNFRCPGDARPQLASILLQDPYVRFNSRQAAGGRGALPVSRIRIGISGWQYGDWQGRFYPADLPQKERLRYLARRFPTVEINGTFYSLKQPRHFRNYYRQTPRDFRFAVKGGRYITHMKRLGDVRAPLANHFASGVLELREKLGPHLWQLPADFRFDADRIEAFLALLPRDTEAAARLAAEHDDRLPGEAATRAHGRHRLRHALEVRHPGFLCDAFIRLLHDYGVALVFSHSDDRYNRWPYFEDVTTGFVYLRLHGPGKLYASPYDERALDRWADRVRRWHEGGEPADAVRAGSRKPPRRDSRDVYVYFDNTDKVHAPKNAQRMAERLGLA